MGKTLIDAITGRGKQMLFSLACVALVVWTVAPSSSHVPSVIETLQEHAEMIASHGHSHGLEEDLIWAIHGHSHDVADHDHTQAIFIQTRTAQMFVARRAAWRGLSHAHWSPPLYRLERPPRA
ncbi:hypothetical protein RXV86_15780 [Alisedimentitalea sp. MJ-SS2]|uniref:hypothetical protein n=1 Tax=Aliisedimentitalea sp. MJ-SS2 TaxID=3049795 RepID=UPI00290ED863|nr:hypothetical protein [Alisedimentitalea sp. MJ-SS2]MDU8928852.1 hypothetical protein [Alisedimentitalea sp. MJ-SS2]